MQVTNRTVIPFFARLRWRLTFLFLGIAIVPIVIITLIVIAQIGSQYQAQIFTELDAISVLKTQQVERLLEDGREQLRAIAVNNEVIAAVQTPTSAAAAITAIKQIADISSNVDAIFIYAPDGKVVLASDDVLLNRVVLRQPYFDASLTGEFLQAPFFDVSLQRLTLIATNPIYQDGDLIAVAAIRYNINQLDNILGEQVGLGESGETYLISQENSYLLTTSRFDGFPQNRAYTSDGIERALNAQSGDALYSDYRGILVFGNYHWIEDLKSGLLTEIDQAEVFSVPTQTQSIIAVLAALIAIIAAVIGLVVSTQITQPITQMTITASAIAQGKFDQRVAYAQAGEVGVLANAFNDMAQAVQERTTELRSARDEALAAQRIAKENSRLKSEFLATMSHELRTPMNAILGFSSIMQKRMGGVEYNSVTERYLGRIHTNSERLLSLINDFLDLSRVESGRMELAHHTIVPSDMARKWVENLNVLAESKGLEFKVTFDPSLPTTIEGDEEALSKIAINLIGNAIKFTEIGSVKVNLSKQGDSMTIAVTDTGIGIAPHAREFIFDEFRQVDQSSKRRYGGTGLGLAIAQKIAREMGGTITLTSELGVGSTFTVMVPLEGIIATPDSLVLA